MEINEFKVKELLDEVGSNSLIHASKYVDSTVIKKLYDLGITNFGENRVESFIPKHFELRDLNITWHFIGHLQRNKAKDIINDIDYLHSLDSVELMKLINKYRKTPLNCFVEVHMTKSTTKNGVLPENLEAFLKEAKKYPNVNIIGLMTMTEPEMTDEQKESVFKNLKDLAYKYNLTKLSMGMSDDYKLALAQNATYVRIGRLLYEGYQKK